MLVFKGMTSMKTLAMNKDHIPKGVVIQNICYGLLFAHFETALAYSISNIQRMYDSHSSQQNQKCWHCLYCLYQLESSSSNLPFKTTNLLVTFPKF
ncbi:hypothetical protein T4B_13824 [Trichinella pseudospiralis]|uniref:Uncharacterized protein n=1 Tax=Trichinella pseudospiralis TaxID=6337 RepID=A0A0V1E7U6_TRIPS|nr:hypothetical protein T4A_10799 [Trichinella pseudospiralis]KRZ23920.1 hypothetical protein T4B_13824 [Trichinella pseudospiralis]